MITVRPVGDQVLNKEDDQEDTNEARQSDGGIEDFDQSPISFETKDNVGKSKAEGEPANDPVDLVGEDGSSISVGVEQSIGNGSQDWLNSSQNEDNQTNNLVRGVEVIVRGEDDGKDEGSKLNQHGNTVGDSMDFEPSLAQLRLQVSGHKGSEGNGNRPHNKHHGSMGLSKGVSVRNTSSSSEEINLGGVSGGSQVLDEVRSRGGGVVGVRSPHGSLDVVSIECVSSHQFSSEDDGGHSSFEFTEGSQNVIGTSHGDIGDNGRGSSIVDHVIGNGESSVGVDPGQNSISTDHTTADRFSRTKGDPTSAFALQSNINGSFL